ESTKNSIFSLNNQLVPGPKERSAGSLGSSLQENDTTVSQKTLGTPLLDHLSEGYINAVSVRSENPIFPKPDPSLNGASASTKGLTHSVATTESNVTENASLDQNVPEEIRGVFTNLLSRGTVQSGVAAASEPPQSDQTPLLTSVAVQTAT